MRIKILSFFYCLLCGVLFAPVLSGAFPYQPAEPILIMSQSANNDDETPKQENYTWRVVPEGGQPEGTISLLFFKEMSDNQICRLALSASGAVLEADLPGVSGSMMIREDNLFLVPGFPVPCDILPVQRMAGENSGGHPSLSQIYNIKRSTGAQTFVDTLEIRTYPVTRETAKANGWVASTRNTDSTSLLQVFELVNQRTGELVSLQLWAADADWWMYEKTRFRQSWVLTPPVK